MSKVRPHAIGCVCVLGIIATLASTTAAQVGEPSQDRTLLRVEQLDPISFGRVAISGARGGSVTIDPATGGRTVQGGVAAITSEPGPARFIVSGRPGAEVLILLPKEVPLSSSHGGAAARLTDVSTFPAKKVRLGPDGNAVIQVGGTLRLTPVSTGVVLSGHFDAVVEYAD